MLVRHLSYFVTLATEQHFSRAAELCHITQPTLSAAIRKLEEDLHTTLVVRGHRYMGLTPQGEKLLSWGRVILKDYDSLRSDLSGGRKGLSGTVRIGVIPAAMPATSMVTSRLLALHPQVNVEIRSMSSRLIQQGLDTFNLDGGLTYLANEPLERATSVPLYSELFVFVTSDRRRSADRTSITWREAAQHRLCLLGPDMQNRRILDKVAASQGIILQPTVVSDTFLAIAAHLRQENWSSIVPHTFVEMYRGDPDMTTLSLVDPVHRQTVGLVLSDREPRSPAALALLSAMMEADFRPG